MAKQTMKERILFAADGVLVHCSDSKYRCIACNIVLKLKDFIAAERHLGSVKHRGYDAMFKLRGGAVPDH